MHHQQQLCDSFPSHKSPSGLAELGLVLELTRTTLPISRVCKHVLAIELPQVSMYEATANDTITVIMSHSQICYEELSLKHAWLNL